MINADELLVEEYFQYKQYVEECRAKEYLENTALHKHHIIPKNCGGGNQRSNLISVSVDDHIQLHLLMAKCFKDGTKENIDNLRSARILNRNSIKCASTLKKIRESYCGENNPFYGKTHSEENCRKLSECTKRMRTGISYEDLYGHTASLEKDKRRISGKRYWDNVSSEEKQQRINRMIESRKYIDMSGGNNPFAKKIEVNGILFGSIAEACDHFNVSRYKLRKYFQTKEVTDGK